MMAKASPATQSPQMFDLTSGVTRLQRFRLSSRLMLAAGGVGLFLESIVIDRGLVVGAESAAGSGNWPDVLLKVVGLTVGPAVSGFLLYLSGIRMAAGPTRLRLDERGLTFYRSSGTPLVKRWSDESFRLEMDDDSQDPRVDSAYAITVRLGWGSIVPITREIFQEIERAARSHGLEVSVRDSPRDEFSMLRGTRHVIISGGAAPFAR